MKTFHHIVNVEVVVNGLIAFTSQQAEARKSGSWTYWFQIPPSVFSLHGYDRSHTSGKELKSALLSSMFWPKKIIVPTCVKEGRGGKARYSKLMKARETFSSTVEDPDFPLQLKWPTE
jgi:hypothetical protein